jgi:hypothetical protein
VLNLHKAYGFGYAAGLVGIVFIGAAGFDGAEAARSGAYITQNHKRGRTCAPTFAHIGAIAALADGMQVVFVYQGAHMLIGRAYGQLYTQPFGFAVARAGRLYDGKINHDNPL